MKSDDLEKMLINKRKILCAYDHIDQYTVADLERFHDLSKYHYVAKFCQKDLIDPGSINGQVSKLNEPLLSFMVQKISDFISNRDDVTMIDLNDGTTITSYGKDTDSTQFNYLRADSLPGYKLNIPTDPRSKALTVVQVLCDRMLLDRDQIIVRFIEKILLFFVLVLTKLGIFGFRIFGSRISAIDR